MMITYLLSGTRNKATFSLFVLITEQGKLPWVSFVCIGKFTRRWVRVKISRKMHAHFSCSLNIVVGKEPQLFPFGGSTVNVHFVHYRRGRRSLPTCNVVCMSVLSWSNLPQCAIGNGQGTTACTVNLCKYWQRKQIKCKRMHHAWTDTWNNVSD